MLSETVVLVSKHALQRYHKRIDPEAQKKDIIDIVKGRCWPAGRNLRKKIKGQWQKHGLEGNYCRDNHTYFTDGKIIFVLRLLSCNRFEVVTCWRLM